MQFSGRRGADMRIWHVCDLGLESTSRSAGPLQHQLRNVLGIADIRSPCLRHPSRPCQEFVVSNEEPTAPNPCRGYLAGGCRGGPDSRSFNTWSARTSFNTCTVPLGHSISISSTVSALPNPKCTPS